MMTWSFTCRQHFRKSKQHLHGTKPTAVLRLGKEDISPGRHPSCCSVVFPSFPSLGLSFPLLLSAENGIFLITTVSLAYFGPARDALLQHRWLLNLELFPLRHGFRSSCFLESAALTTLYKAVLPKYRERTFYAWFLPSCSPDPFFPRTPQDTWEVAFYL